MARQSASALSRRLTVASIVFGLFVLCDILLFGWLMFRSLSQREVERVLLETRAEARDLARRIASWAEETGQQTDDLLIVMANQREVERYIDAELVRREVFEEVGVYDQEGTLIYRKTSTGPPSLAQPSPPAEVPPPRLPAPTSTLEPATPEGRFEVSEAIGNLGTLRIGLSPAKLRQRTEILRRDLLRQMTWIVVVSLLVLASAYAIIWLLVVRARRLEEKAREADRMAYIGTLAAGLAHEIRNPLNSLNLNMQLLEEEIRHGCEVPGGRRLLSITRQEIGRLERLVTDFLLYARPRPLDLEDLPPGELLERVRELMAAELQARGARLSVVDGSGGALVRVDPAQITQLLLNLLRNALAATEGGGRRPELVLAARLEGNRLALSVEDNGVGILPEDRRRIFEVFYSTRKGGTGLGLPVVDRIARAHGGAIEVESTPGVGTKMSVLLPVVAMSEEPVLDGRPAAVLASP
jgi:signal transduction histidine kinase